MIHKVKNAWSRKMEDVHKNKWFQALASGEVGLAHYKSYLQETYHHAGQNPQIQAYCTIHFRPEERLLIKKFYQHAISELGHDVLAAKDLMILGERDEDIRARKPLPATAALIAYGYYQAQFSPRAGYLGYLFHLEFMPTTGGKDYIKSLVKAGVPHQALTFIEEHATVDVHHNRMMEAYVEHFIRNDKDLQEMIDVALVTAELHGQMIFSAFENAERFADGLQKVG